VQAILKRPIYRGTVVWNKTTKRDGEGMRHKGRQPKKEQGKWVILDLPQFRLIEPDVIARVDERLEERRHKYLRDAKGRLLGSPKRHGHQPTHNLLAGFIACQCGATFEAVKGRYVCSGRRRKGPSVCASEFTFPVEGIDNVFLDALEDVVLSPRFIDRLLDDAFAHHDADAERSALEREAEAVAAEITNITKAIAVGGDIPALADALKTRDSRLRKIRAELSQQVASADRETLKAALELRVVDWRKILRSQHIDQARQVLKHLIDLPIVVHNQPKPKWVAAAKPEGLARGIVYSRMASPRGTGVSYQPVFRGIWRSDRRAA
jgi:Recombinase zinc beta ribbon domain